MITAITSWIRLRAWKCSTPLECSANPRDRAEGHEALQAGRPADRAPCLHAPRATDPRLCLGSLPGS
eukprot:2553410-Pyramimonas_sp.AAC.1